MDKSAALIRGKTRVVSTAGSLRAGHDGPGFANKQGQHRIDFDDDDGETMLYVVQIEKLYTRKVRGGGPAPSLLIG